MQSKQTPLSLSSREITLRQDGGTILWIYNTNFPDSFFCVRTVWFMQFKITKQQLSLLQKSDRSRYSFVTYDSDNLKSQNTVIWCHPNYWKGPDGSRLILLPCALWSGKIQFSLLSRFVVNSTVWFDSNWKIVCKRLSGHGHCAAEKRTSNGHLCPKTIWTREDVWLRSIITFFIHGINQIRLSKMGNIDDHV